MTDEKVNIKKLITQAEYAKLKGVTRGRINQMIKEKKLQVVRIRGANLILLD